MKIPLRLFAISFSFLSQNKKTESQFHSEQCIHFQKHKKKQKKTKYYYKVKSCKKIIVTHENNNFQVITENHDLISYKTKLHCLMNKKSSIQKH